ncbi:MAG: hypothetical protein PHD82_17730, partial [Candidatus Riflebacteria bacterium]|nr:hypothetical protein [Candidatus Riflebacteria bacterium]
MKQQNSAGSASMMEEAVLFNDLQDYEKLLCSLQLLYASTFDSYLASWLLNRLSREKIIPDTFSRQQLETVLQKLCLQGFLISVPPGFVLNPQYIDQAFAWPLTQGLHKDLVYAVNQLITTSEYAYQARYTSQTERALITSYYIGVQEFDEFPDFSYLEEKSDAIFTLTARLVFPFNESHFQLLPESSQISILNEIHSLSVLTFEKSFSDHECAFFKYFMHPRWLKSELFLQYGSHVIAERLLLQGDFQRAKTYLEVAESPETEGLQAMLLFLFHGQDAALPAFRSALREMRKSRKKKLAGFHSLADVFYFVALIQNGSPECLQEARQHFDKVARSSILYPPFYLHLKKLYEARVTGRVDPEQILQQIDSSNCCLNNFIGLLTLRWLGITNAGLFEEPLERTINAARQAGFRLPACEGLRLKRALGISLNKNELHDLEAWEELMMLPLAETVERRAPWEMTLEALNSSLNLAGSRVDASERLIWEIRRNLPR